MPIKMFHCFFIEIPFWCLIHHVDTQTFKTNGRKDATSTTCLESGKIYQSTCLEEHIVMVGEPGEYYLSHVSTKDGKGRSIAYGIYSVIKGRATASVEIGKELPGKSYMLAGN